MRGWCPGSTSAPLTAVAKICRSSETQKRWRLGSRSVQAGPGCVGCCCHLAAAFISFSGARQPWAQDEIPLLGPRPSSRRRQRCCLCCNTCHLQTHSPEIVPAVWWRCNIWEWHGRADRHTAVPSVHGDQFGPSRVRVPWAQPRFRLVPCWECLLRIFVGSPLGSGTAAKEAQEHQSSCHSPAQGTGLGVPPKKCFF